MRILLRLWPYLRKHDRAFLGSFVCIVLGNWFGVYGWTFVQQGIDTAMLPGATGDLVFTFAYVSLAIFAIAACFRFLMRYLISGISRLIEYDFRNDLLGHLQRLSPSYYDRNMTGDLMSRATNDMDAVRMVLGPGIMYPINSIVLFPMALVMMLKISPMITLVSLTPLLLAPVCVKWIGGLIHKRFRAVQDHYSQMSARTQENLAGQRVVKALAREREEIAQFEQMNIEYRALNMRLMNIQAYFFPIMRLSIGFGLAGAISTGAWLVAKETPGAETPGMSRGGLIAFIGLYNEMIWPMIAIGWVVNVLERGAASMKRIAEILDAKPEIPPAFEQPDAGGEPLQGRIEFRGLNFSYGAGAPVLHDINLVIEPGRTLGIVGPVGSGKSTLLRLIARIYSVPPGALLIDGQDINDIPVARLRNNIAMAPQETFLFSDTIGENIRFGATGSSQEEMERAAQVAQIAESVEGFPDRYETVLGERGINISGGQKQRTALARAILRQPRILLLDDALSSVDTETEEKILEGLRGEWLGRTTLLVSHRISTVAMADEIVVLQEGRIAERGSHAELIALDGLYADLAQRQRLAEEIESADDDGALLEPLAPPESGDGHRAGGRSYDWSLFPRFMAFLKPLIPLIVLSVVLSMLGAGLELVGPQIVRRILDGAKPGSAGGLGGLVIFYMAIIAASGLLDAVLTLVVNWIGQSGMLEMRRAIFTHLQTLHVQYFDKNPVGRLLTRVMNDVAALNDVLSMGIPTFFKDILTLFGIIAILFWTDWKLTLAVFVCFPLIAAAAWNFSRTIRVCYRQTRTRLAAMNSFLQENLSGMATVQLFGREARNLAQFHDLNGRYRDSQLGAVFAFALFFPIIDIIAALSVALILWHGGIRLISHEITYGALTAFIIYVRKFLMPIRELAEKFNMIESGMAASERIFGLLDTKPEIVDASSPAPSRPLREGIEFRNVWFAYEGEEWVLRDVSFTVRKGQTVAIVGATGAGKTTITSLLLRFYDIQKGAILLDGVDIREMRQHDLRRKLAVVLQDVFLFRGTIADNIRMGRPDLGDGEVGRIARLMRADTFIQRLPGGYAHEILERGGTLSTGQRQLLSFARAMACSPEILVLDEATSNIDTATEQLIQEALETLLEGRTAIVIAHRLSTIQRADKILVMHHGRLREEGTHDELLRMGGIYQRLSALQYKELLTEG